MIKRILLTLIMVLVCGSAIAAELLVQLPDSPYEKGAKKGDIIVVRPDGWKWGKEECPPRYIVIKLPGVSIEEAKKYEETVTDKDGNILQKRKYSVDKIEVDLALSNNGKKQIEMFNIDNFKLNKIKDKTK